MLHAKCRTTLSPSPFTVTLGTLDRFATALGAPPQIISHPAPNHRSILLTQRALHLVEELIDGVEDYAGTNPGGEPLGGGAAFDNDDEDVGSDSGIAADELLFLGCGDEGYNAVEEEHGAVMVANFSSIWKISREWNPGTRSKMILCPSCSVNHQHRLLQHPQIPLGIIPRRQRE